MKNLGDVTADMLQKVERYEDGTYSLTEMSRIGYTNDGFEIYINTDDGGNKPHFYYRQGKYPNFTFHTCIEIKNSSYFHHDGKEDVLNSRQRKDLVKFLKSKCKNPKYETNWEKILYDWNDNNSNINVDVEQDMPNYLELK